MNACVWRPMCLKSWLLWAGSQWRPVPCGVAEVPGEREEEGRGCSREGEGWVALLFSGGVLCSLTQLPNTNIMLHIPTRHAFLHAHAQHVQHMLVCTWAHIHAHAHTHTHTHTHMHMHTHCIHTQEIIYKHTASNGHTHARTHAGTHTHTHRGNSIQAHCL